MVITGSHESIVFDDAEKLLICDMYQFTDKVFKEVETSQQGSSVCSVQTGMYSNEIAKQS